MPFDARSQLRVARPTRDLAAAEKFWCEGLGLTVQYRAEGGSVPGEHDLLMLALPGAAWHLELVHESARPVAPSPTKEDLLVLCLDEEVPPETIARLEVHGGRRVESPNPYWNEWGATIEDPDGYRLVLCKRGWHNE